MSDAGEHLLEEIVWRLEVLTPLHAGSGEQLTLGLDVESADRWTYAVNMEALLDALPPAKRDRVGVDDLARLYPGQPLREVQRYAMPGALHGQRFTPDRKGEQLRSFARDGFGRPYLPGSTLKGALRTALLAFILEKDALVQRELAGVARRRGSRNEKEVDAGMQAAALRTGEERVVDDVLRHLYVPDVPVPPGAVEVVEVKIKSMDDANGWNQKGWLTFVEALKKETVLRVPLRLDARALRPGTKQDFSAWERLLGPGLLDAVRAHGARLLAPEVALWTGARALAAAGAAAMALEARAKGGEALFPVAWGIGWRGMTGAGLERLDGAHARVTDANAEDPPALRAARRNHPMMAGQEWVDVFPKSRRLAVEAGEAALPMGWVAVRAWAEGDAATAFEAVRAPEGRLPAQGAATPPRRPEGGAPQRKGWGAAPRATVAVAVVAAAAAAGKPGDVVRGTLTGKNKKEKWRVMLVRPVVAGTVVEGVAPEGLAEGMEVDLVVKTAALGGQDWQLAWPAKKG